MMNQTAVAGLSCNTCDLTADCFKNRGSSSEDVAVLRGEICQDARGNNEALRPIWHGCQVRSYSSLGASTTVRNIGSAYIFRTDPCPDNITTILVNRVFEVVLGVR
jgi:hypothetical protein